MDIDEFAWSWFEERFPYCHHMRAYCDAQLDQHVLQFYDYLMSQAEAYQ